MRSLPFYLPLIGCLLFLCSTATSEAPAKQPFNDPPSLETLRKIIDLEETDPAFTEFKKQHALKLYSREEKEEVLSDETPDKIKMNGTVTYGGKGFLVVLKYGLYRDTVTNSTMSKFATPKVRRVHLICGDSQAKTLYGVWKGAFPLEIDVQTITPDDVMKLGYEPSLDEENITIEHGKVESLRRRLILFGGINLGNDNFRYGFEFEKNKRISLALVSGFKGKIILPTKPAKADETKAQPPDEKQDAPAHIHFEAKIKAGQ